MRRLAVRLNQNCTLPKANTICGSKEIFVRIRDDAQKLRRGIGAGATNSAAEPFRSWPLLAAPAGRGQSWRRR